jgi:hypothetical protein
MDGRATEHFCMPYTQHVVVKFYVQLSLVKLVSSGAMEILSKHVGPQSLQLNVSGLRRLLSPPSCNFADNCQLIQTIILSYG